MKINNLESMNTALADLLEDLAKVLRFSDLTSGIQFEAVDEDDDDNEGSRLSWGLGGK